MSREIKFRAWDNTQMFGTFEIGSQLAMNCYKFTEQFTGLKDKNGKEIYEGDIATDGQHNKIVKFINGCYFWGSIPLGACNKIKVIGNIHENPELLNMS